MFPSNVLRYHFQWSRAVKGHHGIYVVDRCGSEVLQKAGHTRAIELEEAHGFTPSQHLECLTIIHGYFLNVNLYPLDFFYALHCICQYCQVTDTKKIKLQKTGIVHGVHIVLGNDLAATRVELQGRIICKWSWRDDYASGMDTDVAHTTLKAFADIYYFFSGRVSFVHFS